VRGVVKDFGSGETRVRALHGIDLDINPGELTFLVGESGSGKTTLISIIAGILYPTEGNVSVFDTPIYDLSQTGLVTFRLENIGFIFQQYNLIPTLTAAENASVPLVAAGLRREEAVGRARDVLQRLNIGELAERLPRQMSGGQQQRVAIARALDLLGEVAIQSDRAVIIVTHDNRVFDLADRIIEMEDGRITGDRRPDKTKPMELVH
jgi:putative ABC transport system ATP-binding protein